MHRWYTRADEGIVVDSGGALYWPCAGTYQAYDSAIPDLCLVPFIIHDCNPVNPGSDGFLLCFLMLREKILANAYQSGHIYLEILMGP